MLNATPVVEPQDRMSNMKRLMLVMADKGAVKKKRVKNVEKVVTIWMKYTTPIHPSARNNQVVMHSGPAGLLE